MSILFTPDDFAETLLSPLDWGLINADRTGSQVQRKSNYDYVKNQKQNTTKHTGVELYRPESGTNKFAKLLAFFVKVSKRLSAESRRMHFTFRELREFT